MIIFLKFFLNGVYINNHHCICRNLEAVEHVRKKNSPHPAKRIFQTKALQELDLKDLLNTKKIIDVVVKFVDSSPHLFCS